MHTLKKLIAGEITSKQLGAQKKLQLSENLTEFPHAIFSLVNSLEVLDLSNNKLNALPDDLHRLTKLRILFLSNNQFDHIPAVLANCPRLEMISFKSNQLSRVDENVFPVDTRWLILTDNHITQLPHSMGKLHRLQKFALAGNQIKSLPDSMAKCKNLQLLRLSANQLTSMPDWLFTLPKLSWLAFSGNQLSSKKTITTSIHSSIYTSNINNTVDLPNVSVCDIELGQQLGEGASGVIYQGQWINTPLKINQLNNNVPNKDDAIAVKLFKGSVTSDGYPQDELDCCLQAKQHKNLIDVIAKIVQPDQLGLIMTLIPPSYGNLGFPPSLVSCTRDTFAPERQFSLPSILKISLSMANVLSHLHDQFLSHGDIYAHNTLINEHADILLGDFGAATDLSILPEHQIKYMEKIEVRAFACLLDDLLIHNKKDEKSEQPTIITAPLEALRNACMQDATHLRPTFKEIINQLSALARC